MLDRQISANSKDIKISQDLSFSHAGTVWDGALCQIAYLNLNHDIAQEYITNKNVLELGSGTGILGLAACAFNPKNIYLTDLPEYLKLIEINKQSNQNTIKTDNVKVMPLEWGNFQHIDKITQIDTIIGSQLAYDKGCVQQLMKTLCYYKKQNLNLKIMISYQKYRQQGKNIEIQFNKCFGADCYGLVQWSKMDPDFRDDGIGIVYVK